MHFHTSATLSQTPLIHCTGSQSVGRDRKTSSPPPPCPDTSSPLCPSVAKIGLPFLDPASLLGLEKCLDQTRPAPDDCCCRCCCCSCGSQTSLSNGFIYRRLRCLLCNSGAAFCMMFYRMQADSLFRSMMRINMCRPIEETSSLTPQELHMSDYEVGNVIASVL